MTAGVAEPMRSAMGASAESPVVVRSGRDRPPAAGTRPANAKRPMMGGQVAVSVIDDRPMRQRTRSAEQVLDRVAAWAARLTRFEASSELSRLNAADVAEVPIRPTVAAVLDWAREAEGMTDGLVDVAMLDARLAAETGDAVTLPLPASRRWSVRRGPRGSTVIREPGVRFDLDGVAKGWLADRALDLTPGRSAIVDGDGDVAIRVAGGDSWAIGIEDPRTPDGLLATLVLRADGARVRFGLATSGTSVHRWLHRGRQVHHLIDPWTWQPAETDVVQATVLASSARVAEAFAKVAVIAGSERAFELLDRPAVDGLLLLTDRGEIRATASMVRWLA
jgi:thiamine biosynthesis lipoprotein